MGLSQEMVKLARSIGAAAILAALALPSPVLAEVTMPSAASSLADVVRPGLLFPASGLPGVVARLGPEGGVALTT